MGLEIDKRIDTANKIDFEFSGAVYGDDGRYHTMNNIFQDSTLINASESVSPYVTRNETYNFKSNIEHKFKKKGRVVTGSADYKFSKMSNLSTNEMVTRTVLKTGDTVLANFDRFNSNQSNTNNVKLAVQYIEPIIKEKLNIVFDLNMLYSKDNTYQNTYDRNAVSGEFSDLVRNMSNNYNYDVLAFSQKLALNYKSKKIDFGIGSKFQETKLFQNNLDSGNADLNRSFFFVLPNASVNWKYRRNSSLNLNFNTSIKPPTLAELQPYTSNSGPLFLQIGNPNLVPTYNYRFSLRNSFWYPISQSSLWSSINFTMKENDIVQNVTLKENGEQIQTYTQVNGNFDLRGNAYYSFHIKKLDLNVNPGANFSYGKSSVVNNSIVNS
ncbi:MAG: TonB-dependent receptor domain-containing protein, partial [Chitinophagales bacterium]